MTLRFLWATKLILLSFSSNRIPLSTTQNQPIPLSPPIAPKPLPKIQKLTFLETASWATANLLSSKTLLSQSIKSTRNTKSPQLREILSLISCTKYWPKLSNKLTQLFLLVKRQKKWLILRKLIREFRWCKRKFRCRKSNLTRPCLDSRKNENSCFGNI